MSLFMHLCVFSLIQELPGFPGRGLTNVTQISATLVPVGPVFISGGGVSSSSSDVYSKLSR